MFALIETKAPMLILSLLLCLPAVCAPTVEDRLKALEGRVQFLEKENEGLKKAVTAEKGPVEYPINDQHDNVVMSLKDLITDLDVQTIESEFRTVKLEHLLEAETHGAIPHKEIEELELGVEVDKINTAAIQYHRETLEIKLKSLEALHDLNYLVFAFNDWKTNERQFQWYELELKKAEAVARHDAKEYKNIHALYLKGAGPWGHDHDAELAAQKSAQSVLGWQRKVEEQLHQAKTAEEEYKKMESLSHH